MKIIEKTYKWSGSLTKRTATKYIILHHRAGDGDAESIHRIHVYEKGWAGIGYHFYIRKDGSIYRGRPLNVWGAHCTNYNDKSVAICFEGDFEKETMPSVQLKAGQELISYLKSMYPNAEIKEHRNFNSTACPGKNFPFNEVEKGVIIVAKYESANDIAWELNHMHFPITEMDAFVKALDEAKKKDSPLYWGYYKLVNK